MHNDNAIRRGPGARPGESENGRREKMRKPLVVLVAVLGVAGLVTVGSAHMWGGGPGGTQGYGPGYG